MVVQKAAALLIGGDPFYSTQSDLIIRLAGGHGRPTMHYRTTTWRPTSFSATAAVKVRRHNGQIGWLFALKYAPDRGPPAATDEI